MNFSSSSQAQISQSTVNNTIIHANSVQLTNTQRRRSGFKSLSARSEKDGASMIFDQEISKTRVEMLVDVRQGLPVINYVAKHEEISRKIVGESGQWFLKTKEFEDWKNGKFTGIIAVGHPGAGKSCLFSLVVSHLQEQGKPVRVVYLYLDHQQAESQTPTNIISTLLHQLLLSYSELPESATALYSQLGLDQGLPPLRVLVSTLIALCRDTNYRTYIVLDAFDESKPSFQTELAHILEDLLKAQVQLFATTRPSAERLVTLADGIHFKKVPIQATASDLSMFLKEKLNAKRTFQSLVGTDFGQEVIKTIVSKSEGVYVII
ncbi:hypothetical protein BDN72DRAFT_902908 [Pluteus cervinus]|uniref:Uncharacterized protein n=1 Tax=Pluteus cervinus TaxID=181527 RepID=A0ACD3ABY0_9AGAR|nr:hypothetical protein BDN72DRAFT_902908 [Pluteus cervinus]